MTDTNSCHRVEPATWYVHPRLDNEPALSGMLDMTNEGPGPDLTGPGPVCLLVIAMSPDES